jgi:hypothetical protein
MHRAGLVLLASAGLFLGLGLRERPREPMFVALGAVFLVVALGALLWDRRSRPGP